MPRSGSIRIDTSQVRRNLAIYGATGLSRAKIGMQVLSAQNENRAKSKRRWTDRTGQARTTITGSYEDTSTDITIGLAIGADHGIFLEKANGGKYDIIWPTVNGARRELLEIGRIAMKSGKV